MRMGLTIWKERIFMIRTNRSAYVMEIDSHGLLRHLYWGAPAGKAQDFEDMREEGDNGYHPYADRTMEEYAPFGGMRYKETACRLEYADGTKDFRYRVSGYETEGNWLRIFLQDTAYPCRVTLHYEWMEEEDIICRYAEMENLGEDAILVERMYSAQFALAGTGYRSLNFNGSWAAEFQRKEDTVNAGKQIYESLRGSTAHVANPCFVLHRDADEEKGEVYFGLLAYSGNFKTVVEATPYDYTNVLIGRSDTDFAWELGGGERFCTPPVYCGFGQEGLGGMSRQLHRLEHRYLMPKEMAAKPLPVLYNSWYATCFDVRCEEQKKLAQKAAAVGIELFVVDDGWFVGRSDDTRALGDWEADPDKFPRGLGELIDYVRSLGMQFGLWIEPEMVNEDSRLFRAHPDWVYRYENREILKGRNQYVLDLTREEVVRYLIEMLDRLLTEHEISYLKWDMNRAIGETGTNAGTPTERKMMWTKHMENFYRIAESVRRKHPEVELEACASGGGRVDLGAMLRFDEYWPSDNTDPLDRLFIQENYSLCYPAKYMRAWVTDVPEGETARKASLRFALHAAMCGSLGIGNNLNKMSEADLKLLKEAVQSYKEIRETVQFGTLYRLSSARTELVHAVQYVREKESVVFIFLPHTRYGKDQYRIRLRGLKEERTYRVEYQGKTLAKSGAFLMSCGLELHLTGDYDSCMVKVTEGRRL